MDENSVSFRVRDWAHDNHWRTLRLPPETFIDRFLLHVLPHGFHRIRHYGMLSNAERKANLARMRELLQVAPAAIAPSDGEKAPVECVQPTFICSHCGRPMMIIETLLRAKPIRAPPLQRGAI